MWDFLPLGALRGKNCKEPAMIVATAAVKYRFEGTCECGTDLAVVVIGEGAGVLNDLFLQISVLIASATGWQPE